MDFVFDPSLVLYLPLYQLDGASFMSKGKHGHLCTVTGALWRPSGRYFDGTDDKIDCGSSAVLKGLGVGADFTVEWYGYSGYNWGGKVERGLAGNRIRNSGTDPGILIIVEDATTGTLRIEISDGATDEKLNWANIFAVNTWEHIVITYDESTDTMEAFVNAATQGTNVFSQKIATAGRVWLVGEAFTGDRYYVGRIGEMRIYTRLLSPPEILHNYLATKWRYR